VAFLASMSFDCNLLVSVVSLLRLYVRFNASCINLPMNLKWVRGNFADWVTEQSAENAFSRPKMVNT